jgi:hypothetical protein
VAAETEPVCGSVRSRPPVPTEGYKTQSDTTLQREKPQNGPGPVLQIGVGGIKWGVLPFAVSFRHPREGFISPGLAGAFSCAPYRCVGDKRASDMLRACW